MGADYLVGIAGMSAIELNDVTVSYGQKPVIYSVTGAFSSASLTAITGPNGAGKTTLLKAVMGELPLTNGNINRHGLGKLDIAYLPQANDINRNFPLTVEDLVSLGAWKEQGAFGRTSKACRTRIQEALTTVGLKGLGNRNINALSAGQFQRVLFARVLLQNTEVIILDEPFTAVDERTTYDLLNIIQQWHDEKRTVIAVLHDIEQIKEHFPQTLLMAREAVAWGNSNEVLSAENRHYAKKLMEEWDDGSAVQADKAVA